MTPFASVICFFAASTMLSLVPSGNQMMKDFCASTAKAPLMAERARRRYAISFITAVVEVAQAGLMGVWSLKMDRFGDVGLWLASDGWNAVVVARGGGGRSYLCIYLKSALECRRLRIMLWTNW
jgi:hypothetical protein